VVSVTGLLKNVQDLKFLWKDQKKDFIIWIVCALATVIFGPVSYGSGVGIGGASGKCTPKIYYLSKFWAKYQKIWIRHVLIILMKLYSSLLLGV